MLHAAIALAGLRRGWVAPQLDQGASLAAQSRLVRTMLRIGPWSLFRKHLFALHEVRAELRCARICLVVSLHRCQAVSWSAAGSLCPDKRPQRPEATIPSGYDVPRPSSLGAPIGIAPIHAQSLKPLECHVSYELFSCTLSLLPKRVVMPHLDRAQAKLLREVVVNEAARTADAARPRCLLCPLQVTGPSAEARPT